MAESKKRKNGKKRAPTRTAPPKAPTKAQVEAEERTERRQKFSARMSLIALGLMFAGVIISWAGGQEGIGGLIGYPVSAVGGVMGIIFAREQEKGRTVTRIFYAIFVGLIVYSWLCILISMMTG